MYTIHNQLQYENNYRCTMQMTRQMNCTKPTIKTSFLLFGRDFLLGLVVCRLYHFSLCCEFQTKQYFPTELMACGVSLRT